MVKLLIYFTKMSCLCSIHNYFTQSKMPLWNTADYSYQRKNLKHILYLWMPFVGILLMFTLQVK